jgi:hypothetical protein
LVSVLKSKEIRLVPAKSNRGPQGGAEEAGNQGESSLIKANKGKNLFSVSLVPTAHAVGCHPPPLRGGNIAQILICTPAAYGEASLLAVQAIFR